MSDIHPKITFNLNMNDHFVCYFLFFILQVANKYKSFVIVIYFFYIYSSFKKFKTSLRSLLTFYLIYMYFHLSRTSMPPLDTGKNDPGHITPGDYILHVC